MRCYELKNDTLREGLLITDESGLPAIQVAEGHFLPLEPRMAKVYARAPKVAPIRLHFTSITKDMKSLTMAGKNDRMALVHLELEGGEGGDVSLSACAFDERIEEERAKVKKLYRPFPSEGVLVIGNVVDPPPWFGESNRLRLTVIMLEGASLRVTRSGRIPPSVRQNTFLYWSGTRMYDTPHRKGTESPQVREKKDQSGTRLLPPAEHSEMTAYC